MQVKALTWKYIKTYIFIIFMVMEENAINPGYSAMVKVILRGFTLKKVLFLFILLLMSSLMTAQLSGYYTVGGEGADYTTINDALNALNSQGVSGNVIFALNPGTYPGFGLSTVAGCSDSSRVTIQSASLDSSDVLITGTVSFNTADYTGIKALTLQTGNSRAIYFYRSWDVKVENCRIISSYEPGYNDGMIYVGHYSQGSWSQFTLDHCDVSGNEPCIMIYGGYNGLNFISNNTVTSSGELAMQSVFAYKARLSDNIFYGGIDLELNTGSVLKGNTINGSVYVGLLDSIIGNVFQYDHEIRISCKYYKGNYFYVPSFGNASYTINSNIQFIDNYFECDIQIPHAMHIVMTGNIFLDDVSLSFNESLLFNRNILYGGLNYGDVSTAYQNFVVQNNLIFDGYVRSTGHYSEISYNNFCDSAYLFLDYLDNEVHDNNFCRGVEGVVSNESIYHNNYFPLIYCFYDTNSVHYDPGYNENSPGISTNPLLQGKGWYDGPTDDFLGNVREDPPAIGANEILLCSGDPGNNFLEVPCGEQLYLNMCNLPDSGSFYWTPDSCIVNPDSVYPMVTACGDMIWYLHNSIYGLIDSVVVQTVPFQVQIAPMPLIYCGYGRTLNATYHPLAAYHWTPDTGLSNPDIRNPLLTLTDTTCLEYYLECIVDGCGTSYDTLKADFDPLPNASIYIDQNVDTIFFSTYATCVDEFFWEFGDGETSSEEDPFHVYQEMGTYFINLTITNEYGSNIISGYINVYWTGFVEDFSQLRISIFPNPAKRYLNITGLEAGWNSIITLTSLLSEAILSVATEETGISLDLSGITVGIYLLTVRTHKGILTRKISVSH